jgi:hypothetical protein
MIWYLIRKYFVIAVVLTFALSVLPLIMGRMSVQDAVPSAILWSAPVTPIITYWEFQRQKQWPLFHNLRLPGLRVLSLLCGIQIATYFVLRIWIS